MKSLVEIEQCILGSLFINNSLMDEISQSRRRLLGVHFTDPVHVVIWNAIVNLMENGRIANPVTVKQITDGQFNDHRYLTVLVNAAVGREEFNVVLKQWWWAWYTNYLNSDSWRAKRRKVLDRCSGLCEGCREADVTQVHHLTYAHVGEELLFELAGLCDDCHQQAHQP